MTECGEKVGGRGERRRPLAVEETLAQDVGESRPGNAERRRGDVFPFNRGGEGGDNESSL